MSDFAAQVKAFRDKATKRVDTVVQDVTARVATSLVEKTPVDTGALRANWQFSASGIPSSVLNGVFDQEGSGTIGTLTSAIREVPAGGVTYLVNNLPYMPTIEYGLYPNPPKRHTGKTSGGYSTQAPGPTPVKGMTVLEFPTYVKDAIATS